MTHFGLDLEPSRRVLEQLFSLVAVGQNVFILRARILRPSSDNIGLDSPSNTHLAAMTATPPKDSHHDGCLKFSLSCPEFGEPFGIRRRSRAGNLLPDRTWKCRPVDALVRMTLFERGVAVRASGNPDFGKKGWPQDGGTASIGSASSPTRGGRPSARATGTSNGTEHASRPAPGQGGVHSRLAVLKRETDRTRIGTEQSETPIGSDGSETLKTIFAVWGSSRGSATEVDSVDIELKDKLFREQPMAAGQKRPWESGARHFLAMAALQLKIHLACDGGWNQISQPWDVIEHSSAGGRATQPCDGGLDNSLRNPAAPE